MRLTRIVKRWHTAKKPRVLVKMSLISMGSYVPAFILGYHDFSFGALI